MNLFNRKPKDDLNQLLKQSQQNFQFDQNRVKDRLLYTLREAPMSAPKPIFFRLQVIKYAAITAGFLIFVSATFAFASNAVPGQKLFALNKLGEQVLLNLPLTVEQKAQLHAHIVTNRLNALQQVHTADQDTQMETVKESDESINQAIQAVSANRDRLQQAGQISQVEKLDQVLNRLDDLASQHEQQIKTLEASMQDPQARSTVDVQLHEIKNARHRARVELKIDTENDDN